MNLETHGSLGDLGHDVLVRWIIDVEVLEVVGHTHGEHGPDVELGARNHIVFQLEVEICAAELIRCFGIDHKKQTKHLGKT